MYTLSTTKYSEQTISCCYCWQYPCTPCLLHNTQNIPYLVLLLTVSMYAMSATQYSEQTIYCAIVDSIHVRHVCYTILGTYHILCYCWLYPCTPCLLHNTRNIPYLVLLLTVSMYAMSATQYSEHTISCAIVDCIHVHHVCYTILRTYHILCYCWLYPCTPCLLHNTQNIPYLVLLLTVSMYTMSATQYSEHTISCAIVDCIHVRQVCYTILGTNHILCYCWLYPCTPCLLHNTQNIPYLVLLLTVSMYAMSATQYSEHTISCAIVDCIHVHLVHYTILRTYHILCYCWLYPCTPCLLHNTRNIPYLVLLLTVSMYAMSATQYSEHTISCAIVDCIHVRHVCYTILRTYHILCYCWLYPCTPCPLHNTQNIPYLVLLLTVSMYAMSATQYSEHTISCAIVDCIHVRHVCYTILRTYHILCYCWLYPCTPCPLHNTQNIPYLVLLLTVSMCAMSATQYSEHTISCAIVDCIHVRHVRYTILRTYHILCYCWLYPCTPSLLHNTRNKPYLVLLLTVSMYAMSATQYSEHTISCAIVDCIHVRHVCYTILRTYHILCYCWLYPCTPCPLHNTQNIPYLVLLLTVSMYAMSATQYSEHTISCAIVDCIHVRHVCYTILRTYHILCYCWLYPCTPCPLHNTQNIPYLVLLLTVSMYAMSATQYSEHTISCAIVDCIHVRHVCYTILRTYHILCYCWLYPCTPCLLHNTRNIPYLVLLLTVSMCAMSATKCSAFLGYLVTLYRRSLELVFCWRISYGLPPLEIVTVDPEHELNKPNNMTKQESFVVVRVVSLRFGLTILTISPFCCCLWISGSSLLQHLESSGNKVVVRRVLYICYVHEETKKYITLVMVFTGFFTPQRIFLCVCLCVLLVYYLSECS